MSAGVDFLVNLRNMTASAEFRAKLRPTGYLVAPAYLTAALRQHAADLSRAGAIVVADNGLFDDIMRLGAQLEREGDRNGLARRAAVLAATVDPAQHREDQLAVKPTAMVGVEDITAALWTRLGLTARTEPGQRAQLRARNRRTARTAVALARETPAGCDYLAVASAQDYDTAFDAGREFADAGLDAAALGFGAFMSDDSTVREVKVRGRYRRLTMAMPNRYLATALVARGFWDGWATERDDAPRRFHFLGLGAPIMVGVVTCAAARTPSLSFDATSPIKDAAQGTLYVSKPAYLKIRTWKVAQRLVSGDAERWNCRCPFCEAFNTEHPFDYARGLSWYRQRKRPPIGAPALRRGGALYGAYPLLAQPSGTPLGRAIDFARVGHNHWALKQVTDDLARARENDRLEGHVDDVVAAYEAATPLRAYAAAVRLAFAIARGDWP